jgi:hypothetical protein
MSSLLLKALGLLREKLRLVGAKKINNVKNGH